MKTITLQIGNSDDKLTQAAWSDFVQDTAALVSKFALQIHFFGSAVAWAKWQNCAWVFTPKEDVKFFELEVCDLARKFRQDCIAVTKGDTAFCYA